MLVLRSVVHQLADLHADSLRDSLNELIQAELSASGVNVVLVQLQAHINAFMPVEARLVGALLELHLANQDTLHEVVEAHAGIALPVQLLAKLPTRSLSCCP